MCSNIPNYASEPLLAVPPPPQRFSYDEWYKHITQRYRLADDQALLADRILDESTRVIDVVQEKLDFNKEMTEMRMKEKILDIEFVKSEIERSKNTIQAEIEVFGVFKDRIRVALEGVRSTGKAIAQKCIILREGRLGIDLVKDNVEMELKKEIKTIDGCEMILIRTLEQVNENLRQLRSFVYLLDRDLEGKLKVLAVEHDCLNMRTTDLNLSTYHGTTPLDAATVTYQEWQHYTNDIILRGLQCVNTARNFRNIVSRILVEVVTDLKNQCQAVNEAFCIRIEELKEFKVKFEKQLFEVTRQINEMTLNITALEKAIAEKEGYLALAHTRLGKRAHRVDIELVKDEVERMLVNEVLEIRNHVSSLQQMMEESQASLRYLCKTQIQLQEDINIKINSIKIDEVDCMTLRQAIQYYNF